MTPHHTHDDTSRATELPGEVARETQKGIRRIIGIWENAAKDRDPTIRFFTVGATLIAFFLLVLLIFASLETSFSLVFKTELKLDKYLYLSFVAIILLAPIMVYAGIRMGDRAQALMLEDGFQKITRARYGGN